MAAAVLTLMFILALAGAAARAQAPSGPIPRKPGVEVQLPPRESQAKVKVQVALVNTPVTVRDGRGEMVHNLEAGDFQITDNGVAQRISHFDLGGDPLSLVILIETSSRIEPLLPQVRKTGILFTQTVMGPTGEGAVVGFGFNDAVDKLQDFTTNSDLIENTIAHLGAGASGSKLYDAMAVGVEMLSGRPEATADKPGRRRALMILSEATDAGSEAKLGEVLRHAQLANVTIYSVGLSTTRAELQAKPKDTRPQITPPGTFPLPPQPGVPQTPTSEQNRYGNIDLMIDEVGGELHSQYNISYTPAGADTPGYHEINVSIVRNDAKNLKIRARPGYYLAAPES